MALNWENIGTIENTETGEVTPLRVARLETVEDFAAAMGMTMEEVAELQEQAEEEEWG
ncbi:hypothetical protein RPALISO_236 [Ruegeria phage RpAliso]|nr:hypothetical protein RPALISO_236 [Ruegeria phage RpAliso]